MAPRRIPGPDWAHVGWHYKAIHRLSGLQNRIIPVRAKGLENVPRTGPVIVAANHCSWWDGILLQTAIGRPVNLIVKREIMASRFGRWFFGRGGAIPVDRSAERNSGAFDAALGALGQDRILGLFPEGSRNDGARAPEPGDYLRGGGIVLNRPKTGVGRFALATGAPVVPVGILSDRFWPRGRSVPRLREPVYVHGGEPVSYAGDAASREEVAKVADDVMRRIASLLDEAHAARGRGEKWDRPA